MAKTPQDLPPTPPSRVGSGGPVLDPIARAKANPRSKVLAIRAKCFDCEGRGADPCWQWRVGNCVIPECPLYPVRPYQKLKGKPKPAGLDHPHHRENMP